MYSALDDDSIPTPGASVTLLSEADGLSYDATVRSWQSGDLGLVVTARLEVDADAVDHLSDHRVWVSVPGATRGCTVFGGVAHPAGEMAIDVTGVVPIVREQRRRAPRIAAPAQVVMSVPGRPHRDLRAVDLSRGGVRVALPERTEIALGEQVEVEVHLENGATVPATGEVTRVDRRAKQAVVRFDHLSAEVGDHLDRYVLFRLTHAT